ncbi:DUF6603 domain-containing protein [Janthinobacterium agaricidamnosum]|uniref:DUF6603 domain-containing protein n=1 Tax=Janthinobacterium agaricidamnosum NBRC 102515 = DSM 9628 TaxID=1349767 RepID=W0UYL8_9BURK|nr:DUF6603 domain-containing protein [Janthinobacterium agaricidamnosum]CDG81659.1 hypothetical protein GJA_1004 [Janthinobacterium agaricidamnosum NBRC 102515 = DSM 9628]
MATGNFSALGAEAGAGLFDATQLAPTLVKLGVAVGLLRAVPDTPDAYVLNAAWFENPLNVTGDNLGRNGATIALLFAELLGEVSAGALGLAAQDLGAMGVWNPIPNPQNGKATGFYLVNYPVDAARPDGDQVFGIGILHQWQFQPGGANAGAGDIAVRVWGLLPVLRIGQGGMALVLGQSSYPLNMGLEFAAPGSDNMIDSNGLSFNGVKVSAQLSLAPSPAVDLSVVILKLKLPTEVTASDRNLGQIAQITPQEWLSTVSTLCVTALQRVLNQDQRLAYLLPIFGLSPVLPNSALRLPLLGWEQLLSLASAGQPMYTPFVAWFNQLLAQQDAFAGWMGAIAALLGMPSATVDGAGSQADPYRVALLQDSQFGTLLLTMVSRVDAAGTRYLLPGLNFRAKPQVLGSAPAQIGLHAQLDLAQFSLATSGSAGIQTDFLNLVIGFALTNTDADKPLFEGNVGSAAYVFGSLTAGISVLQGQNAALKVVPAFQLNHVSTPNGAYAVIDLTQAGDLVDQALQELYGLVDAALQAVFGVAAGSTYGAQAAVLLGVIAPAPGAGVRWPASLAPPFSAAQLVRSFQNPVAALADYYAALVHGEALAGGHAPVFYVLQALGGLLNSTAGPTAASGSGSVTDPWLFPLAAPGSGDLPASLLAYIDTSPDAKRRLTFGLQLAPSISFGSNIRLDAIFSVQALSLELPVANDGTALVARIFPGLAVQLALPQGFTTPQVAGAAVSVASAGFTGGWSPYAGWHWNMTVGQPAVVVDGNRLDVGQGMVFSDSDSMQQLVTRQAASFAPVVVALIGVAVYRTGNRPGLALNGVLGLLPQLGPFMPAGLAWPAQMPLLQPSGFSDPVGDLQRQLSALLAHADSSRAALALLGWSVSNDAAVPQVDGDGSVEQPFGVPFDLPGGVELAVWTSGQGQTLGAGLRRDFGLTAGGIVAETGLLLRLIELGLTGGVPASNVVPSLRLRSTLTPATALSIPGSGGNSLVSISFGLELGLGNQVLALQPLLHVVVRESDGSLVDYDLQQLTGASSQWLAAFYGTVNLGLSRLVTPLLANSAVNNAYRVLQLMNLVLPLDQAHGQAAINAAGWSAMLSAPLEFFRQRGIALFSDSASRALAVALLQDICGIALPPVPLPLLQVLHALQLVEGEAGGYAPRIYDLLQTAAQPAQQLRQRFTALVHNDVLLAELVGQLDQQLEAVDFGPLQLAISQGALFSITLGHGDALMLGNLLQIKGALRFDLRTSQLAGDLELYCAQIQLALRSQLALAVNPAQDFSFGVDLAWGDGSQTMPLPLRVYPFSAALFLEQIQVLAPDFALATFLSQVVDARLLNTYPVARTALTALGLVRHDSGSEKWFMRSPLGLFGDPLQWLLGDAVLGRNGQLNIATLRDVFATITSSSQAANGVGIAPVTDGVRIFGLPYGQQITLVADVDSQQFTITPGLPESISLPLLDGVMLQDLSFALSLGPNFQPGVAGSVGVSGDISAGNTLLVTAGYRHGFLLSAGLVQSKQTFQVLPFPGWQTLVLEAAAQAAQMLLKQLNTVLLDQLAAAGAADFVARLRSAGSQLQVADLISELAAAGSQGADAVGTAALSWLTGRLSSAHAANSVAAVVTLLQPYFPQIQAQGALLSYRPSDSLPVTLLSGVQTLGGVSQLGLWTALELPASTSLVLNIEATGIGIPLQADGQPAPGLVPRPHFQFSVLAPLQDQLGPKLEMHFDVAQGKFVLGIDPAGGSGGAHSEYYRELLPMFFGEPDASKWGGAVLSWLEALLLNIVPRYVSIVVLNQSSVKEWMAQPLFPAGSAVNLNSASSGGPSAAQILMAAQLLIQSGADQLYMLNSLQALQALTIESFLAGFLRALLADEFQLIRIGAEGGIWVGPRVAGDDYFGLRVMLPNMSLAAVPYVTFQLGDADTGWISSAGGDADLKGGISLYVPISATAPDFARTVLEFVNIGLDFVGKQKQNLVQLQRFSMRAIQPRGLITFDFGNSNPVSGYGGGITLSDIGMSLAPNVATGGGNAVAQNLLGSGSSEAPQQDNPAANPTFSVRTSYVKQLYVELFNGEDKGTSQIWFPVQRSFGPLYANKIGAGWQQSDYLLQMLFDGNVSLAGLYIGVDTLSVGVPVKNPLDFSAYQLDLAGLDISFKGGAVEINGAFLKQDSPLRYDGAATVKAARFGLSALGSYAELPVDPAQPDGASVTSLFVFANLNIPLGPDPAFFINGLAAGFGYNRNILIPEPGEIAEFPLVKGAISSSVFGGKAATPDSALEVLSHVVYPEVGQYWGAGGIQFSTYQLLNSFALLIVRFGREFAIDLVGITSASFPPKVAPSSALAYLELGLLVSFRPSQGMVSVRAQLTPNSFILSQDCRLTGGFAAVLWYQGEHAGDFVLTLGGYHPAFKVPEFYPVVPRLGFNWPMEVGGAMSLNIAGGSYFALTPSAVMAGGYLQVLFKAGPLRAWFNAGVDFLIQWQPFYFMLNGYVSVGAGIEVTIAGVRVSLSAEIGARLLMWGPPIAGLVNVNWYVISFSIPFGDSDQSKPKVQPLAWDAFQKNFLPPLSIADPAGQAHLRDEAANPRLHPQLRLLQSGIQPPPVISQAYAVLKAQVEQGLLDDFGAAGWVVATPFIFNINTVIPSTLMRFDGAAATFTGPAIGIQPMAQPSVTTPLTLSVLGWDTASNSWVAVDLDQRRIAIASLGNGVPEALWSKQAFDPNGVPQAKVIPDGIVGASIAGLSALLYAPVGPMDLTTLAYVTLGPLPLPYAWTPHYPQQPVGSQQNRAHIIAASIMAPAVVELRDAIYAALRDFGQPALRSPDLTVLAHNVGNIFQSPPSLAALGATLLPPARAALRSGRSVPQPARRQSAPAAPVQVDTHLVGSSWAYRSGVASALAATAGRAGLPLTRYRSRAKWLPGNARASLQVQAAASLIVRGGAGLPLRLLEGTTSIVRLGSDAQGHLRLQGGLPLRICSFNQYQEPLAQQLLDPAQHSQYQLPPSTEQVVAIAQGDESGGVAGWYRDGDWTRLNHYYFHAGNSLVRPQAIPNIGDGKHGAILAGTVLDSNQVQTADGGLANGWLETLFLDQVQTVAVVIDGAAVPRVQLCWSGDLAHPAYAGDASASSMRRSGDLHIHLFDVPPRPHGAGHAALAVLVFAARQHGHASLQGVLGWNQPQATLAKAGIGGQLASHAASAGHAAPRATLLQLS